MRNLLIGRAFRRKLRRKWRKSAQKAVNLLFPLRCPVCDEIVPAGEGKVCGACAGKIRYIHEPVCEKCGRQLVDGAKLYCGACERTRHLFDKGIALYDYQSMKNSIYRFKYKGRREYAEFYAEDIYRRLKDKILDMDAQALIPIPLHKTRLRTRGYNQAELIARRLSALTGVPVRGDLVERVRNTIPQKQLDARERQNNLKKAFHIKSDVVKLKKAILIDDIYTTGSTMDAVAAELKRRGVECVCFIALCIGEGF